MTKYEDVKHISTEEYFNNNRFSIDAFKKKYAINDQETYIQAIKRVCDYIALAETPELRQYWSERWFDEIYNDWWHPAGSIMQGANCGKKISLLNCTTISLGSISQNEEWDTLESIIKNTAFTVAKCAAYRQGLGVDFSRLRPMEANVLNSSNKSQGAIHWMKFIDSIGYYVGQRGRIPAMLFSISCTHPDLEDFIKVKSDYTKIQNANISVQITDDFYKAVEKDLDWEMFFEIPEVKIGDKIYIDEDSKTRDALLDKNNRKWYILSKHNRPYEKITKVCKARYLLELIAKNMMNNSEPGIQNIDLARKYSNSDYLYDENSVYDTRIISTNACVSGDTEIITKNGIVQIQDKINNEIEIWNGFEWSKVVPKITNNNQEMLKIGLSDGRFLRCTKYHDWIISKGYWNGYKKVKAINLKIGDKVEKYNFPILDNNKTIKHPYTQGFISGDGMDNCNVIWLYEPKYICQNRFTGVTINDNDCVNSYTGMKRKAIKIDFSQLPKNFVPINYSLQTKLEWLAGLMDSDGCELKEGGSQIASCNFEFLQDVQKLLSTCGINSKIVHARDAGNYLLPDGKGSLKEYYCNKIWRICIGAKQCQDLKSLGLKCERLQFDKFPNRDASRFSTITSIELDGVEENVYCFDEPIRHFGVFNGILTGQCSEQYLSRDSLCCLGSINLGKFPAFDYEEQLKKISYSINRFLDNVNEMEIRNHTYATPMQRIATEQLRRTGAGYTNLCAWLLKRNELYGSKQGIKSTEEITKLYNYYMYESSISLGKEKGNFKAFNREKFEQSPFIQRMIGLGLEFKTMRNVTCSSLAPTGTLSLMFRDCVLSYGAEPGFGLYFWKRTRISGKYEYYFCVPNIVREIFEQKGLRIPIESDTIKDDWAGSNGKKIADFIDNNKDKVNLKFLPASEVSVFDKLDMMSGMMKWIDSSISITYMLPEKSKWQDIYDFILLARKKEVKSIAAFPDKKMYGIVSFEPFKTLAKRLITDDNISIHPQNFSENELKEVVTWGNVFSQIIPSNDAIKRPKELDCHIYHYNNMGVVVGLLNGTPYEVFFLKNFKPTKQQKTGKIIKIKQKHYRIICDNEILLENAEEHCSQEQEAMARLTSLSLRHNVNMDFIIKQLETVKGDMYDSCRALCKALRHYAKNDVIKGETCPQCGSKNVTRHEGCKSCTCGWSAC